MDLVKVLKLPSSILETIFSYLELVYYEYIIYKNPRKCKGLTIIKLPITYLKDRKKRYVGFVGY
jgi:hypothetical protein